MKRYILLVAFAIVWINPIYSQFSKYHLMKDASAVLSPRSTDYHRRLDSESVHLFRKPFVNIRYVKYKDRKVRRCCFLRPPVAGRIKSADMSDCDRKTS